MAQEKQLINVEVKSQTTGRTIMTFETEKENAHETAWKRVARFLRIDRAVASMNYFVEIN